MSDEIDAWGKVLRLDRVPKNLQLRVLKRLIEKLDPATAEAASQKIN
jgi:hypothetical protein